MAVVDDVLREMVFKFVWYVQVRYYSLYPTAKSKLVHTACLPEWTSSRGGPAHGWTHYFCINKIIMSVIRRNLNE